jgi:hypothetical protein
MYGEIPNEEVEVEVNNPQPSIDTTGMSHSEKIKMACSATGVIYSEPRNGCRKCSGKGYIGIRDDQPIICPCVLRDNSKEYKEEAKLQNGAPSMNRKQRRQQQKWLNKMRKMEKNNGNSN